MVVMTDARGVGESLYVVGREEAERFGKRLWSQIDRRGLDKDSFVLILGDGALWIWNLAEMHLPGVPQLLDF
jgi:hypothetical protein